MAIPILGLRGPSSHLLLLSLGSLLLLLPTANGLFADAESQDVVLRGRFAKGDGGVSNFDFPGSEIAFKTTAGCVAASISLSQELNLQYGQWNHFEVFVDGKKKSDGGDDGGDALHSFSTEGWSSGSIKTVTLAEDLDASRPHTISVFKSTEPQFNSIVPTANYMTFHGVNVTGGSDCALDAPPTVPSRRIEFIGDSITCGYCNLCEVAMEVEDKTSGTKAQAGGGNPAWLQALRGARRGENDREPDADGAEVESHWDSWAPRIARQLDADFHTVAWSGYGLVQNCCGGDTTLPAVYRRALGSDPSDGNAWNFSSWTPQAVVINLGTNDGAEVAATDAFVDTYVELAKNITGAYGVGTELFLACGPMATYYCDAVGATIDALTAAGLRAHFLDQTNAAVDACCGHPSVDDDIYMATSGADFIAGVMGW